MGSATPAIALLTKTATVHTVHAYDHDERSDSFGAEAGDVLVERLGVDRAQIFKTLVIRRADASLAVALVPVTTTLSMKSAAAALNTRKVTMADRAEAERSTGYVFGGISPLGQRKVLPTVVDESALTWSTVLCSAGRRGLEIEVDPRDLIVLTRADVASVATR